MKKRFGFLAFLALVFISVSSFAPSSSFRNNELRLQWSVSVSANAHRYFSGVEIYSTTTNSAYSSTTSQNMSPGSYSSTEFYYPLSDRYKLGARGAYTLPSYSSGNDVLNVYNTNNNLIFTYVLDKQSESLSMALSFLEGNDVLRIEVVPQTPI